MNHDDLGNYSHTEVKELRIQVAALIAERDAAIKEVSKWEQRSGLAELKRDSLLDAAQAVVDRWDAPAWKDVPHTAKFIHALRDALEGAHELGLTTVNGIKALEATK